MDWEQEFPRRLELVRFYSPLLTFFSNTSPTAHRGRNIGSSRLYILDTKPDPKQPKIVKVIEPEEFIKKTGYTSPHTIHCGPDCIYGSALGSASGDGPVVFS